MAKATKKRKKQPLRTEYIERLDNEQLREALRAKLTVPELAALERQIRQAIETGCTRAVARAVEETYKRQYAVTFRVLRDRFGFGHQRLRRLWDLSLEYINDIDAGLLSTDEMLETLVREDGIRIAWRIRLDEEEEKGK